MFITFVLNSYYIYYILYINVQVHYNYLLSFFPKNQTINTYNNNNITILLSHTRYMAFKLSNCSHS